MKLLTQAIIAATLGAATTFAVANTAQHNAVNHTAINQTASVTTVKQALTARDDTRVQLKGYIVKALGDEKYQFRDSTGVITVDIDDELWQNRPISAKTPVTLIGEVDVDYKPAKRVEIDVDHIQF